MTCEYCTKPMEYQYYTIRICNSSPMHAFKCLDCKSLRYTLVSPPDGVKLCNN